MDVTLQLHFFGVVPLYSLVNILATLISVISIGGMAAMLRIYWQEVS